MTDDPFMAPRQPGGMRPAEPMGSDVTASPTRPTFSPEPSADDAAQSVPGPPPPPPPLSPPMAHPQPPAPYAAYPPAVNPYPKSWMNIVAFVTSLIGIGLVAIVLGHMGVAASNRGEAQYKGRGIAGLVIGYLQVVGLVIGVLFAIVITVTSANA